MIITADWHLDDNPANEYRWQVFKDLHRVCQARCDPHVAILGDLCDRKDKHSSKLVNRLIQEFSGFDGFHFNIIMGNHDAPINGTPFWQILNYLDGDINFHTIAGDSYDGALFLPFTPNPIEAWKGIDFKKYRAVFLHQPIKGARVGGHALDDGAPMPIFPRGVKVYAGDVHYPQRIGQVTYVGAPHRVRFGDEHECRMLALGLDYSIIEEIKLDSPCKSAISITGLADLDSMPYAKEDMLRVQYTIDAKSIESWPVELAAIKAWAAARGVRLDGVTAVVENLRAAVAIPSFDTEPRLVLQAFGLQEGLDKGLMEMGLKLLEEAHA
jgi:hypothetical protein